MGSTTTTASRPCSGIAKRPAFAKAENQGGALHPRYIGARLFLWHKIGVFDSGGAEADADDSEKVADWTDRVAGYKYTQSVDPERPTRTATGVHCGGSNVQLTNLFTDSPAFDPSASGSGTVIIVASHDSGPGIDCAFALGQADMAIFLRFGGWTGGVIAVTEKNTINSTRSGVTGDTDWMTGGAMTVLTYVSSGSAYSCWVDLNSEGITDLYPSDEGDDGDWFSALPAPDQTNVGAYEGSSQPLNEFDGVIAEIIEIPRVLSANIREFAIRGAAIRENVTV